MTALRADPARARRQPARSRAVRRAARRSACRRRKSADQRNETASDAERVRPAQQLDEHAADAVAGEERERAAAVDERVRLHVVLARHEHLDHRAVRDVEEDAQRSRQERDDVELRPGQVAERVGDRDRADQQRPADVGREHHVPAAAAAVDPGAGVQGEDQVRDQVGRRQRAHLARGRVEGQDGGQRQRDRRDLVAEQRNRLPDEETAKVGVGAEERRQHGG